MRVIPKRGKEIGLTVTLKGVSDVVWRELGPCHNEELARQGEEQRRKKRQKLGAINVL
jgi:hypothetical protein